MFDFDVVTGPSNILRTDEPAKAQAPANPRQAPRGASLPTRPGMKKESGAGIPAGVPAEPA